MIILIIGPSGSGKGTQAALLAKKLNLPAISMGQLMRDEIKKGSTLGKQVKDYVLRGLFTPTKLTLAVLKPELAKHPKGFILDGFPRRLNNLTSLETYLEPRHQKINKIIYLQVSDDESVKRLLNRAEHDRQKTGQARHDDTEAVIRQRLQSFHQTIDPILDYAEQKGYLEKINGERSIEAIHQDIVKRLSP